jgi:hypothetical protein
MIHEVDFVIELPTTQLSTQQYLHYPPIQVLNVQLSLTQSTVIYKLHTLQLHSLPYLDPPKSMKTPQPVANEARSNKSLHP